MKKAEKFSLVLLGMWLGITCLIDFLAVPAAFRNISSRQEAGTLGMILFNTFNYIEVGFSLMLGTSFIFYKKLVKRVKLHGATCIFLLLLSLTYAFYMSPRISEVNRQKWELSESSPEYKVLEKEHQFLHSTFRKTDSIKILILLVLIGSSIMRKDEEVE
jgi:hypothetical protein